MNQTKTSKTNKSVEYSKIDVRIVQALIREPNWCDVFSCSSVSDAFDTFIQKIQNFIVASKKSVKIRNKFLKPWVNSELKKDIDKNPSM